MVFFFFFPLGFARAPPSDGGRQTAFSKSNMSVFTLQPEGAVKYFPAMPSVCVFIEEDLYLMAMTHVEALPSRRREAVDFHADSWQT